MGYEQAYKQQIDTRKCKIIKKVKKNQAISSKLKQKNRDRKSKKGYKRMNVQKKQRFVRKVSKKDPVSLRSKYSGIWKRDSFLNKRSTKQSNSMHVLSQNKIKQSSL